MILTPAFAQTFHARTFYAQTGGDSLMSLLVPMLLMVVIVYFLVIRPQQQRAKEHREMVEKVRRGDTVVLAGGFVGRVTRAAEGSDEIEVELSDTLKVRILKATLTDVRAKHEPAKDAA